MAWSNLYACSCIVESIDFSPLNTIGHDRIFVCQVIYGDTSGDYLRYKAITIENFVGNKSDTVEIWTFRRNGMCGFPLHIGRAYLIYGNQTVDNKLFITICGPSHEIERQNNAQHPEMDTIDIPFPGGWKRITIKAFIDFLNKRDSIELTCLRSIIAIDTGSLKTYFVNNSISGLLNIKNHQIQGYCEFYFENGMLKGKGDIIQNKQSGYWVEYTYRNNTGEGEIYLMEKGNYFEGQRNGKWKKKLLKGDRKKLHSFRTFNKTEFYK